MNESAKYSWTSARCNRLLRPLSSKIALLRKTLLSESKHDECSSGFFPPSSSHKLNAMARIETEWEVSPRPWKRIKHTYSSRTNGQSVRASEYRDKGPALTGARDTTIRLPIDLTEDQAVRHGEDLAVQDSQDDQSAQRAPPRAARGTTKNAQVIHVSQVQSCAISTGLSNRKLKEGICKAFEALLSASTREKTKDNGGCRPLFSVCLRQIPTYIAEEQRLTNAEDPENDIDVASDVYAELEAFGAAPDGGWESLREVVRAHGVSLVREAIQESLIDFSLSRHILHLCVGLAAYDEAECVVESMITCVRYRPVPRKEGSGLCAGISDPASKGITPHQLHAVPPTDEASQLVGALRHCVSQSGRHGFMYRQIAVMLEDGTLPVDWISSKAMIECWNGVIRSITQQDDHAQSAALLLQTAISKSYKPCISKAEATPCVHDIRLCAGEPIAIRPTLSKSGHKAEAIVESQPSQSRDTGARRSDEDNGLQSTFSNILTVLSAINILRLPKPRLDLSHPNLLSVALLRDTALEIRQALELASVTSTANFNCSVPVEQLRLPLLSAGLVSVASRTAGTEISPSTVLDFVTLANLPSSKDSLSDAGSFLCEVARCCGEAGSGDGFSFIQIMVQGLISIAISGSYDKATQGFCSGVAHAAAFAFSEDTGQPKHLDWALNIEGTITRTVDESPKVVADKTPARPVMRNKDGYKWEEGICEWIAKTPALRLQRPPLKEGFDAGRTYGEVSKLTLVHAIPLLSDIPPCDTDRQLSRSKRGTRGRRASCESREVGHAQKRCGNHTSSEKLLFVRVSPRPHQFPRLQFFLKTDAATYADELSTPESSQEQPLALQEIANPPSGIGSRSLVRKHHNKDIGSCALDVPLAKRQRFDAKVFSEDMDDELSLP